MTVLIAVCISQHYAAYQVAKTQADLTLHACLQWFDRKIMSFHVQVVLS